MNVSGFQGQLATTAFKSMVRASIPYTLKILDGARDIDTVTWWARARKARGGGLLMLRYVPPDESDIVIEDMHGLIDEAIAAFWGYRFLASDTLMVILEVPINEKFHTNPTDFMRLCEETVLQAPAIAAAGFTPGVLITSEGNPPGSVNDPYGASYFLQPRVLEALRELRKMGAVWCPHGYSHPPYPSDDSFHFARPGHILDALPLDCQLNYAYGEFGCDGGCDFPSNNKPGQGYKAYFDNVASKPLAYRLWAYTQSYAMAQDVRCLGGAMFLSGADPAGRPNFQTFDIGDEVDMRPLFAMNVPGPTKVRLDGGNNVPVVNGKNVGQGVADKMAAEKDVPLSDEQYVGSNMSFTFGQQGMYVYSKDANETYFFRKS